MKTDVATILEGITRRGITVALRPDASPVVRGAADPSLLAWLRHNREVVIAH